MAELAYFGGVQPTEVGQLTRNEATELLRRLSKLKQEDQQARVEELKVVLQGMQVIAQAVGQLTQVMVRAFSR